MVVTMFRKRELDDLRERLDHVECIVAAIAAEMPKQNTTLRTGEVMMGTTEATSDKRWYDNPALSGRDRAAARSEWTFEVLSPLDRARLALSRLLDGVRDSAVAGLSTVLIESPEFIDRKAADAEAALDGVVEALAELRAAAAYYKARPVPTSVDQVHSTVLR
jgi:hypothetical protein